MARTLAAVAALVAGLAAIGYAAVTAFNAATTGLGLYLATAVALFAGGAA